MCVLNLKLLVTTGVLLLASIHWPSICLGDERASGTTLAPKLGRQNPSRQKILKVSEAPHKRFIKVKDDDSGGEEEDDGYMESDMSKDREGSQENTETTEEPVDDGFQEDWHETTIKPTDSDDNHNSAETTAKPSESDDGYDEEGKEKLKDKVKGKDKEKEKNKDKDKDKGKGKENGKMKTGLDSILPEDCGRIPRFDISGYISGGFDAQPGEYPPYVRVDVLREGEIERDFCGGTLITNRHIITAAHCLEHAKEVDVTPTIHAQNGGDKIYKSKKFCYSPGYDPDSGTTTHDLGLVTLEEPIKFNDLIQPACLPDKPLNKKKILRAIGLGASDKADIDPLMLGPIKFPDVLQVLPVKTEECNSEDKDQTTICFVPSDPKHKGDTCAGDSGGPIFGLVNKKLTIFGATSHGPPICKKGVPGKSVNADIYNLRNELRMLYNRCGQENNKEHVDDD